jgi:phosphomannomutase
MKNLRSRCISKIVTYLFIGDKLQPGGNDYAVKAAGIDTIEVKNWQDTADLIERILADTN